MSGDVPVGTAVVGTVWHGTCFRKTPPWRRKMSAAVKRVVQLAPNRVAMTFGAMWAVMLASMWYLG